MPLVLSVFAPDAAAQSEAQPATVAGSELTRTSGALERLDDVDTLLSLTSEGALLYENDEVKLDGYQYCSQAVALAERGELRRSVQAASKALHVALQSGHNDLLGKAYRDLAITFSYAGSLEIGRAHVCTPVTNAHLVCRLLLEKKNHNYHTPIPMTK